MNEWNKIKQALLDWYRREHRQLRWRETKDPYEIWISEIMLQQTRVEAVKGYYDRFLEILPDVGHLANVDDDVLLKLWEGLGYYNRARNLKKAATQICEIYHGQFPVEYEQVLGLSGIGEYTAGAICSICYEQPTPAVDGNVLRVWARLKNSTDNIDEMKTRKHVRNELKQIYESGDCGLLTQAWMELGAMVCVPNGMPKCTQCPLQPYCQAYKEQTFMELPVRKAKKKRRIEEKTVFVLHDGDYYGISKRSDSGLLAGMWEFYHTDETMDAKQAVSYIAKEGFEPVSIEKEIPYTHVFSHVEWRMKAYFIECRKRKENLKWVKRSELDDVYALPTAFKTFMERESLNELSRSTV